MLPATEDEAPEGPVVEARVRLERLDDDEHLPSAALVALLEQTQHRVVGPAPVYDEVRDLAIVVVRDALERVEVRLDHAGHQGLLLPALREVNIDRNRNKALELGPAEE